MKISDIIKKKSFDGEIGLEIELEGLNLPKGGFDNWRVENDGSLRSGLEAREYVLDTPITRQQLRPTLTDFTRRFGKATVSNSFYAGTHVHINIGELTPKQTIQYICAFIVLEDLLVEWCGDTRVGNHFCLRTSDAYGLISYIRNLILKNDLHICNSDEIRYASFNIKSITKYGSLEFRSLNSSLDVERMVTWCEVLLNIKDQSIGYDSPADMLDRISSGGYLTFARQMLGKHVTLFLSKDWERKIRDGVLRSQDIAYCKDWNQINLNVFKQSRGGF